MDLGNHKKFQLPGASAQADDSDCWPATHDTAEILQLALESAGAGVWERDLVTEIVRINPQCRRMLGLPDDHSSFMTKEEWQKLSHVQDLREMQDWLQAPGAAAAPHTQSFRSQGSDGEVRWLRISARLLPDRDGRLTRLVGLMFDDTDRKRTEDALRENEERLRVTQEAALIGSFVIEGDGRIVGSRQFYRNLGLPEDTPFLDYEVLLGLMQPEDRKRVMQAGEPRIETGDGQEIEYRINRADTGELRWIFSRIRSERADDGQVVRIVGAHLDITEPKRAEAALHESVALNQGILEASADCVKLIDLDGRLLFMNKPGLAALEVEDPSTLWEKDWAGLWPRAERRKVEAAVRAARNGQNARFDGGCPTAKGEPRWWDVIVTPIRDEQGQTRQLLAISRDVTEQRNNLAQIRWTASHDMLTELPNRRFFQDRLGKAIDRAAARGSNIGLLHIDVDDFKQTNDALGHDAGDALLRTFTQRLLQVVRSNEMVARLGGDEFAIIVPDLGASRSLSGIVDTIQARLAEPFVHQGRVFDCRASIGQAIYPQHGETVDDLLKSADIALYAAKASGRGNVRLFDPSMRSDMQKRLDMIGHARTALRDDRISPFYQPKIDFVTGSPAGFEALLRWHDLDGRVQLPVAIAAAFEDLDVAQALSERMQLRVLADIRRWLDDGIDFGHVAINASAAEFRQNDFAERLLNRVKAAGVPTSCLELEVTETVFLGRGADYVERALQLLSAEGMRIALDDFGTGYASLSHLKQFPVDVIKIDQSFVRNIGIDPDDSAIIKALIGLGKKLSIRIVAEGIENQAQAAFLAEQGCDFGQGYLFSRAVAAADVPELLSNLNMGTVSQWDRSPLSALPPCTPAKAWSKS